VLLSFFPHPVCRHPLSQVVQFQTVSSIPLNFGSPSLQNGKLFLSFPPPFLPPPPPAVGTSVPRYVFWRSFSPSSLFFPQPPQRSVSWPHSFLFFVEDTPFIDVGLCQVFFCLIRYPSTVFLDLFYGPPPMTIPPGLRVAFSLHRGLPNFHRIAPFSDDSFFSPLRSTIPPPLHVPA